MALVAEIRPASASSMMPREMPLVMAKSSAQRMMPPVPGRPVVWRPVVSRPGVSLMVGPVARRGEIADRIGDEIQRPGFHFVIDPSQILADDAERDKLDAAKKHD